MLRRRVLAILMSVGIVFASVSGVRAQDTKQGGSGLSISPPRVILSIEKGKADNIQITLKNTSGVDIVAKAEVNDFESDGVSGDPKIIVNTKNVLPTSVKKFLVGVEDIPLKKDETRKFDIPVQVPNDAVSGAYYGVIRYTAEAVNKAEAAGKQVSLNASLGMIVLLEIPGNITEQLQAQKLSVESNGRVSSLFVKGPNMADIALKNVGTGFSAPYGKVIVSRGGKVVFSYEMNNTTPRSSILPGNSRTFKDEIKNTNKLGRYTVTAAVSYGKGGDILNMKATFWVLPIWFLATILALLILIALGGVYIHKRMGRLRR